MRRWLYEPPDEPAGVRQATPAQVVAESRRLYAEITEAGGSTIDTPLPEPGAGSGPLAARTLVQPDGDVICLVHPSFLTDPGLRVAHRQQVEERLDQLRGTVEQVGAMVRTLSLVGAATVGTATGAFAGFVAGSAYSLVGFALSFATVPVLREGLKGLLRRALR